MSKTEELFELASEFEDAKLDAYKDAERHLEFGDDAYAHIEHSTGIVYEDISEKLWEIYDASPSVRFHSFILRIQMRIRRLLGKTEKAPDWMLP